jgi:phage FluMu gp28-like protein
MALTETTKVNQIEVIENNSIQVRTATIIEKDGVEIAKTYHRHIVTPTDSIENEDSRVKAIANAIWTNEVIAKYKQDLEKLVATK